MSDSVCRVCANQDECPIGHSGFVIKRCGNAILLSEEQTEKREAARKVEQK